MFFKNGFTLFFPGRQWGVVSWDSPGNLAFGADGKPAVKGNQTNVAFCIFTPLCSWSWQNSVSSQNSRELTRLWHLLKFSDLQHLLKASFLVGSASFTIHKLPVLLQYHPSLKTARCTLLCSGVRRKKKRLFLYVMSKKVILQLLPAFPHLEMKAKDISPVKCFESPC